MKQLSLFSTLPARQAVVQQQAGPGRAEPFEFYATFDVESLCSSIPPSIPVLLPASSWARKGLKAPRVPAHITHMAADSGGFVASRIWGEYRYSLEQYVTWLNNHILPELGHYRLRQLTVQHIESFYARKAKQGLAANSLKVIHGVLHNALAHAVYLNLVARNVSDIAKKSLPRQRRFEIQPLTKEQAQKLLEQARGEKAEALLILAISTGMRRGELVALRWSDIHLEEEYLQVQRSARYAGKGYGLQITEPKTKSSRRKIVLSPLVIEALLLHRARQDKIREAAGNAWQAHNLVFCDRHGEYLDPDTLRNWLKKLLKEADLPSIRFHDLRHSAATLLMERGVHAKVVQELLGHSSIMMTLDIYSHVLPSLQEHTKDKLDDLFNDQEPEKSKGDDQQDADGKHEQAK